MAKSRKSFQIREGVTGRHDSLGYQGGPIRGCLWGLHRNREHRPQSQGLHAPSGGGGQHELSIGNRGREILDPVKKDWEESRLKFKKSGIVG